LVHIFRKLAGITCGIRKALLASAQQVPQTLALAVLATRLNKKLSYRRQTARRV